MVIEGDLDEADAQLERAYTWRPRWASVAIRMRATSWFNTDDPQFGDQARELLARIPQGRPYILGGCFLP